MTTAKLLTAALLSLSIAGCVTQPVGESEPPQIVMGGVAGMIAGTSKEEKDHVPVVPDPNYIPFRRKPRGQVRFEMPIERNFKPSPKFSRSLPKKESHDPVSRVIEMNLDPDRDERLKRLVEE